MKISRWAAAAAGLAVGALALAGPAAAGHNDVSVDIQADGCRVNVTSAWANEQHLVDNTKVVVRHNGATGAAVVGSPFGVELAPGTTEVEWRVWGGGERDYDDPALADLPALLAHLEAGGSELDADAPGVAWHELAVEGCEPQPTPTATASPQPTVEPSVDPTTEPSETPAPGAAGGGEQLPTTGSSLPVLTAVGAGLLGLGGGALALVRRRRQVSFES